MGSYQCWLLQHWVNAALETAIPGQDLEPARLRMRQQIADYFAARVDYTRLANGLTQQLAQLDAACERIGREVEAVIESQCRNELAFDDQQVAALLRAIERQRHGFEVTQDLEDESFLVRVKLPGRLEGHNGVEVDDGFVVYRFHGRDLRDREHRLVAITSREIR